MLREQETSNTETSNPAATFCEKVKGNLRTSFRRNIIRMKVIPPFRKEHFQYPQLHKEMEDAINESATIF